MRRLSYEAVKDVKPRPKGESGAQRQDINGDRNANGDKNEDNNEDINGDKNEDNNEDITQACAAFEHKACAD